MSGEIIKSNQLHMQGDLAFSKISTFIFDIDGVMTDGTVMILENGLQARRMSIKDGYALQLAVKSGYTIHIVSGGAPSPVSDRLNKLGIYSIYFSVTDKKSCVEKIINENKLNADEILFMGDDIPDLPVMPLVGIASCPADAVAEIKEAAHYISQIDGGMGCVREVIEKVLKARGHWNHQSSTTSA